MPSVPCPCNTMGLPGVAPILNPAVGLCAGERHTAGWDGTSRCYSKRELLGIRSHSADNSNSNSRCTALLFDILTEDEGWVAFPYQVAQTNGARVLPLSATV
jgi:hypothetical protein